MLSSSNWPWEDMLAAFQALGGAIDNIRPGIGPRGRGLFVIDNTRPVCLRLPENLLFATEDVVFVGERLRLKDTACVGRAEREFFERYEETYSWGAGGRDEWMSFESALDALPDEVRALLANDFAIAKRLEGDVVERAGRQFLRSRAIGWKNKIVIMPLMELANNGEEGLDYLMGDNLRLEGMVIDEVLVSYGAKDPWILFFNYGYAGATIGAFSLAMKMNVGSSELAIGRDTDRATPRGNYLVPEVTCESSSISLSHLMLGHAPYPSLPRGIFRALMKESFGNKTDEIFDSIRHFNRRKLLRLLAALEPYEGATIAKLEKMARFQLEAISWSIGSADLAAPVPRPWQEAEAIRSSRVSARSGWTWDEMLDAFRDLGGVAENIRVAYGPFGRGIFPVRRETPLALRVPPSLLFPLSDIVFIDGQIQIRAEAAAGAPEREFFARYEEAFSWGGEGQTESAVFIAELEALPSEARELLGGPFGMKDLFEGGAQERAQERFLRSRMIRWNGRAVVAPVAELANHRPDGIAYGGEDFLAIEGAGSGEIFVSYRPSDAFACFRRFGFASAEPGAFSLPMKAKAGKYELIIQRDIQPRATHVERDQDRLVLSSLLLGHRAFPRMPRGIFRKVMTSAGIADDECGEAFDRILHFNRTGFIKLLEVLAPHDGRLAVTMRKMARFQLEAMSWCIGSREV